jgi:glycosyltransferase involved in cell wall biosynthesis
MDEPLVSVLMTSFNREKYIGEAIDSVLRSEYGNFELIIVDDASSDNTVKIAKSFADKDPRVRLYENPQNLGDYQNRNQAASFARGKYLKYVDSDDLIYPHTLNVMVEAMEKFPEAGMALSARSIDFEYAYPFFSDPKKSYEDYFILDGFLANGPLASIIRRDVFMMLNGFSGKRMVGDLELWLIIAARYPILRLPKNLVYWRQHEEQEYKKGFDFYVLNLMQVYKEILTDGQCPFAADKRLLIFKREKKKRYKYVLSYLLRNRKIKKAYFLFNSLRRIKYE